jgi:hypothetical protein
MKSPVFRSPSIVFFFNPIRHHVVLCLALGLFCITGDLWTSLVKVTAMFRMPCTKYTTRPFLSRPRSWLPDPHLISKILTSTFQQNRFPLAKSPGCLVILRWPSMAHEYVVLPTYFVCCCAIDTGRRHLDKRERDQILLDPSSWLSLAWGFTLFRSCYSVFTLYYLVSTVLFSIYQMWISVNFMLFIFH